MFDALSVISTTGILAGIGASLRWNWWRLPKAGVPVLMYHRLGEPPSGSRQKALWISGDRFAWHLETLRRKGYESVTFLNILKGRLPAKPVVITFDDGYLNQKETAFPILEKFGMKGVFYIVTETVGKDNAWHDASEEARQPMMTWDDVQTLAQAGHEIGSHAMTHRRMDQLPTEEARRELSESKKSLEERTGLPVVSFAFPYGLGEDKPALVEAAHDAGYGWVLGIHAGIWKFPIKEAALPRIYVRRDDFKLDFHLQLSRGRSRL